MPARMQSVGGGLVELQLSKGLVALIDDADAPIVEPFSWWLYDRRGNRPWYACTSVRDAKGRRKNYRLHRLLLCFPLGLIDHINGNGLDNRRCNLRLATVSENALNTGPRLRQPFGPRKTMLFKSVGDRLQFTGIEAATNSDG